MEGGRELLTGEEGFPGPRVIYGFIGYSVHICGLHTLDTVAVPVSRQPLKISLDIAGCSLRGQSSLFESH